MSETYLVSKKTFSNRRTPATAANLLAVPHQCLTGSDIIATLGDSLYIF